MDKENSWFKWINKKIEVSQKTSISRGNLIIYILLGIIILGFICSSIINDNTNSDSSSVGKESSYLSSKPTQNKINYETTSDGQNSNLKDSIDKLKEATEALKEQSKIFNKVEECATLLCNGQDTSIPAIKSECTSDCYQIYYYGGESSLDKYISELKK